MRICKVLLNLRPSPGRNRSSPRAQTFERFVERFLRFGGQCGPRPIAPLASPRRSKSPAARVEMPHGRSCVGSRFPSSPVAKLRTGLCAALS
jgi:hypothetical protein